jgi:hypothetical protein
MGDLCGAVRPVTWPGGVPEGEVDGLVEDEYLAAGVGLPELLVTEGDTRLVEAFLAAARVERIPPGSDLVHQRVLGAVQDGCPVPVTWVSGQAAQPEDDPGQHELVAGAAAPPEHVLESGSGAVEVVLGPQYLGQVAKRVEVRKAECLRGVFMVFLLRYPAGLVARCSGVVR